MTLANIVRNALRPGYFFTMAHKVIERIDGKMRGTNRDTVRAWCERHAESADAFARSLNPALWDEALKFGEELDALAKRKITADLHTQMGGGGHYPLIYFLIRLKQPLVAVETGVSAGYSTVAVLTAMEKNRKGHLYSSDFPLFRMQNPESYIGYLVDDHLKHRWTLDIRGDRKALPRFCMEGPIEFFHYDSDKSVLGRQWATDAIQPRLSPDAVVLIDDINNNWHFRDYSLHNGKRNRVFPFEGKFAGMSGL